MRTIPSLPADSNTLALRSAFRALHARSLHGFALLLALGDRPTAARLAEDALAHGAERGADLRHPERAAAWLRAEVTRAIPRRRQDSWLDADRSSTTPLDADPGVMHALGVLSTRERAALIAADVERLDLGDVELVAGKSGRSLERLLVRARRRYIAAFPAVASAEDVPTGSLVDRVRTIAMRSVS